MAIGGCYERTEKQLGAILRRARKQAHLSQGSAVDIAEFGEGRALIVERLDRLWAEDGRLLRLPQEDTCQALSIPPTKKYQPAGGPGMRKSSTF